MIGRNLVNYFDGKENTEKKKTTKKLYSVVDVFGCLIALLGYLIGIGATILMMGLIGGKKLTGDVWGWIGLSFIIGAIIPNLQLFLIGKILKKQKYAIEEQYYAFKVNLHKLDERDSVSALSALTSGGFIVLDGDVVSSSVLTISKDSVIDFGEYSFSGAITNGSMDATGTIDTVLQGNDEKDSITYTSNIDNIHQAVLVSQPTLTIESGKYISNANSVVVCDTKSDVTALIINGGVFEARGLVILLDVNKGKVIINGGTFKGGEQHISNSQKTYYSDCVNVGSGADITINGGSFTCGKRLFMFHRSYDGKVTITGGTFTANGTLTNAQVGQLVIKGGSFNVDPTKYLATGYTATENNGVWTVTKKQ